MPISITSESGAHAPNQDTIPASKPKRVPRAGDGSDNAWPSGDDSASSGETGFAGAPGLEAEDGKNASDIASGINLYIMEIEDGALNVIIKAGDGGNGGKGGKGGTGGEGQDGGRGDGDVSDANGGRGGVGGPGGKGGKAGKGGSIPDINVYINDPNFAFGDIHVTYTAGVKGQRGQRGPGGDGGLGGIRGERENGVRAQEGEDGPEGERGDDNVDGTTKALNIYLG